MRRFMNVSAASSGDAATLAPPAVVPGHHGIQLNGVSNTETAGT
jgi:hypothetical protein